MICINNKVTSRF